MKYLCLLLAFYLLSSCGNKKAEIVEQIKKTKNDWYEADMKRSAYLSAAKYLMSYEMETQYIKKFGSSDQAQKQRQIYKEAYEGAIKELKDEPAEILKDQNRLSSIANKWEFKADDLKRRLDSLELELKKY